MIITNRFILRPVRPDDYPRLYEIESDPTTAMTWRYRGEMPTLEEYEPALWRQTQLILVVEGRHNGDIIGYLQLHDVDLRAGHGWFSLYTAPQYRKSGIVMEGLFGFGEYVFPRWPIRWLYAHSFEQNVRGFESGIRRGHGVRLGVLRERMIVDGEPTDVHVIGVSREAWLASPTRRRFNTLRERFH